MEFSEEQKAGLAAGMVFAQSVAVATGPIGVAAVGAASAIINGVLAAQASGVEYTRADFDKALAADDVAIADDLAAQAAATP